MRGQRIARPLCLVLALRTRVPARALVVVPLAAAIAAVGLSSQKNFDNDVRAAWRFRGVNAHAALFDRSRNGTEQSVRALLDLVSHDGDPLLVWTNDPWPYLNLKRVAATRFFYKRFLLGEIYLGRTSRAYVLPETWRWFAQDLRRSNPVAYLRVARPEPSGNPFASYVARNFDLVLPDPALPVSLRHDVARQVLVGTAARDWVGRAPTVSRTGWKVDAGTASYAKGPVSGRDDQLTLSTPIGPGVTSSVSLGMSVSGLSGRLSAGVLPVSQHPRIAMKLARGGSEGTPRLSDSARGRR